MLTSSVPVPANSMTDTLSSNMALMMAASAAIACLAVFGITMFQRRKAKQLKEEENNFVEFPNYGRIDINDEHGASSGFFDYTSLADGAAEAGQLDGRYSPQPQQQLPGIFVNDDDIFTDSEEDDDSSSSGNLIGRVVGQIHKQSRSSQVGDPSHDAVIANASAPAFVSNYYPDETVTESLRTLPAVLTALGHS